MKGALLPLTNQIDEQASPIHYLRFAIFVDACTHESFATAPVRSNRHRPDLRRLGRSCATCQRSLLRTAHPKLDNRSNLCIPLRRRAGLQRISRNSYLPSAAETPRRDLKHSCYGQVLSNYGVDDTTRIKHAMASVFGWNRATQAHKRRPILPHAVSTTS